MKLLIAEDDEPKCIRIQEFIAEEFPGVEIEVRKSVTSTLASLRLGVPHLILLDMSLPTFEIAPGERGGRPQDFGGIAVMNFMEFEEMLAPVIIVTQYESFSTGKGDNTTLDQISARASTEHPGMFVGLVYYSSVENSWRELLRDLIRQVLHGRGES